MVNVRVVTLAEVANFDPHFYCFINVNTPQEFRQAELLARENIKKTVL
jgi:hypothetical protein